jgi:L-threonylcarbamoyladenylate synthase
MKNKKEQIIRTLQLGGVVLMPTDTVYGLAALPANKDAVAKIYRLKKRPENLFLPVMVADPDDPEVHLGAELNPRARKLFRSALVPGALTFVLGFREKSPQPEWLQGRREVAVRIPDHPLLLSVLRATGPLLVTSANRHGARHTPNRTEDILRELNGGLPDLIVEDDGAGSREIPSTIINCRCNPPVIERDGVISSAIIRKILNEDE